MSTELKKAWELYLSDSNEASLLNAIERYSEPLPKEFDFPYAHRIRDIKIGNHTYRVARIANDDEPIYIYECETPSFKTEGVPYWLKGEKLQRWVRLEIEQELDEDYDPESDINWEMFR